MFQGETERDWKFYRTVNEATSELARVRHTFAQFCNVLCKSRTREVESHAITGRPTHRTGQNFLINTTRRHYLSRPV